MLVTNQLSDVLFLSGWPVVTQHARATRNNVTNLKRKRAAEHLRPLENYISPISGDAAKRHALHVRALVGSELRPVQSQYS